jgi:hypothetical protein
MRQAARRCQRLTQQVGHFLTIPPDALPVVFAALLIAVSDCCVWLSRRCVLSAPTVVTVVAAPEDGGADCPEAVAASRQGEIGRERRGSKRGERQDRKGSLAQHGLFLVDRATPR